MTIFAHLLEPALILPIFVYLPSIVLEVVWRFELIFQLRLEIFKFVFFQDVLENEDVKLDNMFTASMVADIIRVRHAALIHS